LEIEENPESEVVQIGKSVLEASDRIPGRLRRVAAGNLNSVIIQRVAKTEPIAGRIILVVKAWIELFSVS
jgi:hypothetical protein